MTYDQFITFLMHVLGSRSAQALALSKGGWEGWLQCELWNLVSDAGTSIEREVKYPHKNTYCDLVFEADGRPLWVEMKAFGYFRQVDILAFLDSFAADVDKLTDAPDDAVKLALLVVPKNIGEKITQSIKQRWPGVSAISGNTVDVFLLKFG